MDILGKKAGTKRPVIVRAATSLFAQKGIDPGHLLSWYRWHRTELQRTLDGSGNTLDRLRYIVGREFAAATEHREAFARRPTALEGQDYLLLEAVMQPFREAQERGEVRGDLTSCPGS